MKKYILASLVLLAVLLIALLPLMPFRGNGSNGTLTSISAFKGIITQVGSRKLLRWVFSSDALADRSEENVEGLLLFRTNNPGMTFSGIRGDSIFLNESGSGEDLVVSDTGFPTADEPRTAGAWVKTSSISQPAFFNYGTEAPHQRFSLMVSLEGKFMFASVGDDFAGVTTVNDGNWHSLVMTYDGKTANLYVDGQFDGSKACDLKTAPNGTSEVGSIRGESAFFTGMISAAFISNYVLPAAEIRDFAKTRPKH